MKRERERERDRWLIQNGARIIYMTKNGAEADLAGVRL